MSDIIHLSTFMETKFQTSFIPKRSSVPAGVPNLGIHQPPRRRTSSIFMTIAVILFIVSLVGAGGAYTWKRVLTSSQETYREQLRVREQQFNISLIEKLKLLNARIDLADNLLGRHVAVSGVFDIVSRLTVESIRFMTMELTSGGPGVEGYRIALRGYGSNLPSVAFQSDVLAQLEQYGLRKVIRNPIISDPTLDAEGTVSFTISAAVDPESLSYARSVLGVPEATE